MRRADTHGRSRLAHDVGHSVRFRAPSSFGPSETSPGYDPDVPQDAIVLTTVKMLWGGSGERYLSLHRWHIDGALHGKEQSRGCE
jgi:hypothetical protein